jgi:predicted P-loop ATPase
MNIDQQQTIAHLEALGYSHSTPIYLRCFPKNKGRARNFQGTIEQLPWGELDRLQAQDYGIYFVVNGQGHKDVDVRVGRVVFFEHDDLEKSMQMGLWKTLGLPTPTIQVDTGGKSIHSYWRLQTDCDIAQWRTLQADLLAFADADRSIKNPSRVMRLAGFTHPGTGQLSTIVYQSNQCYSYKELRSIVPHQQRSTNNSPQTPIPLEICLTHDDRALLQNGASEGHRNTGGAKLARNLIGTESYLKTIGQSSNLSAIALFQSYCSRCHPPICAQESAAIWESAIADNPMPSLTKAAIANCIDAWHKRSHIVPSKVPAMEPTQVSSSRLVRDFRFVENKLGDRLRLNMLKNRIELDGKAFDITKAQLILALEHNLDLGGRREQIEDILTLLAERRPYSPVIDYLESVYAQHGNDTQILTGFADRYLGDRQPMADAFLKRWLISAVARAFQPGCKADYILVLQGKQGWGKSGFFNTLANSWFDDGIAATANDKDQLMKLHSAWIIELSELEAIFRKKDVSAFKAFITARTDALRKPYGRLVEELPRANVFGDSTNEDGFLNDPTGNRRFWVIHVCKPIDIARLEQEKDQIWAAAVALYKSGECWHPTQLEAIAAEAIAQDYQQADPWLKPISDFLGDRETVLTANILENALQVEVGRQGKADEMRVAAILRELGFHAARKMIHGRRMRVWVRSPDDQDSLGQPPPQWLATAENQTPQVVEPIQADLDNLNPIDQTAANSQTPIIKQLNLTEPVVQVVQVSQTQSSEMSDHAQPLKPRLPRLANYPTDPN